ncbi:hypothetical protein Mal4_43820 [Maioricimonas rarisocia]|uniref:Uncharacterized protein n=1 Tax=Maioricimonas rarisocia TaxID=2528026 RepID=A0A517ZC21_9PLAN|nr:hypothetical protein Mal4_43820 [Maioricimonas rarisocia]
MTVRSGGLRCSGVADIRACMMLRWSDPGAHAPDSPGAMLALFEASKPFARRWGRRCASTTSDPLSLGRRLQFLRWGRHSCLPSAPSRSRLVFTLRARLWRCRHSLRTHRSRLAALAASLRSDRQPPAPCGAQMLSASLAVRTGGASRLWHPIGGVGLAIAGRRTSDVGRINPALQGSLQPRPPVTWAANEFRWGGRSCLPSASFSRASPLKSRA